MTRSLIYMFVDQPFLDSRAPAVCKHIDDGFASPSPSPESLTACGDCTPSSLWLDIMIVSDSSTAMPFMNMYDIQPVIRELLFDLDMSRAAVRVGIVTYTDKAEVFKNLKAFNSDIDCFGLNLPFNGKNGTNLAEGITTAVDQFYRYSTELNARQVIVVVASDYKDGSYSSPKAAADSFKASGGVIIAINYNNVTIPMLDEVASPGYRIDKAQWKTATLEEALCNANCFCPSGLTPFTMDASSPCTGRCSPTGGCYRASTKTAGKDAAQDDCKSHSGNLISIHSNDQQFFATSR